MTRPSSSNRFDCIVVGGGPAGLSAALTLGRARRRVLVIDDDKGINRSAEHSHGFLSRDGIAPAALREIGRGEVEPYGVRFHQGTVSGVQAGDDVVIEVGDVHFNADRLLLAVGARYDLPPIPGLADAWGVSAAACPFCHGWELRDRPLGILMGNASHALHLARLLRLWSEDLTIYANGLEVDVDAMAETGARLVTQPITRLVVEDRNVTEVLTGNAQYSCGGLFFAAMPKPNNRLVNQLALEVSDLGFATVGPTGTTSNPLVFCAGNAAAPATNLIASAAAGQMAATAMIASLVGAG